MNNAAQRENRLALENFLGLSTESASSTLNATVLITCANDEASRTVADHLSSLLSRTLAKVLRAPEEDASPELEIVIGDTTPATATALFVRIESDAILVSKTPLLPSVSRGKLELPLLLLGSCYAAGFVISTLLGDAAPFPEQSSLKVDFRSLFGNAVDYFNQKVDIGTTHLIGAGAIGNGFMLGLSAFPKLTGKLVIVDHDFVSSGNLNRCVWFEDADIGHSKAGVLKKKAEPYFAGLAIESRVSPLKKIPENTGGAWLKRMVVAVDSRRARRSLQSEMPGEVFDASTTGLEEIVFHHHKQPTTGACLGCIYYADEAENQRTHHIADALGVSVADVANTYIDEISTKKIKAKYGSLAARNLVGIAYDSFFKELCGEGALIVEGKQVIAPLAFVSTMAGVYLAIEFVRRIATDQTTFNFSRFSPWLVPTLQTQRVLSSSSKCQFCSSDVVIALNTKLWSSI
jgi:molybdopterin/thiamine biosynthesis adenylyltransferase